MTAENLSPEHERNAAIYVAVIDGTTFGQLAERYGISKAACRRPMPASGLTLGRRVGGVRPAISIGLYRRTFDLWADTTIRFSTPRADIGV
jgi:hypothetical protein